ncbi:MAG TPA: inositol monophosphatase [bacterium]|nr:inositol monophosphatase [bacterium]
MKTLSQDEKNELFQTATAAARLAGAILKDHFEKHKEISYKGRINIVTDVDYRSEEEIINLIKSRYPEHDIIAEESNNEIIGSPFRWVIDPLDGTVNYAHDFPFFAVSIALEINGEIEIGIVYNPIMDEFFHARKGEGAFLNNVPISVSKTNNLEKSLLATGFPYDIRESSHNLAHFNHLIKLAQGIRRPGSAALDICYCAMGRFDGYWEITILPWDIAAGILIVTEAGGIVSKLNGEPLSIYDKQVVASNGRIHNELVKEIQTVNKEIDTK